MALARQLGEDGEVDALVPERVWREVAKGLMTVHPGRLFQVLELAGALSRVMPGLLFDDKKTTAELHCAAGKDMGLAARFAVACRLSDDPAGIGRHRSEEHTSELQSLMRISYAVFCLKTK